MALLHAGRYRCHVPIDSGQPATASRIRVLVADDSPSFVAALTQMLGRFEGVDVVATAADGQDAIEQFVRHAPDLAIVDVDMPGMNGIDAAAELRRRSAAVRILMVSFHDRAQVEAACRRAGADAFVSKVGIQRRLRPEIVRLFPPSSARRRDEPSVERVGEAGVGVQTEKE